MIQVSYKPVIKIILVEILKQKDQSYHYHEGESESEGDAPKKSSTNHRYCQNLLKYSAFIDTIDSVISRYPVQLLI